MSKKCLGCGSILQVESSEQEGYVRDISMDLCERCFRITNYGDYKQIVKSNEEYINILKQIGKTKELVVLVVDIFNINKNLSFIKEYIDNDILLVINKRDILPKSVYDDKLINYFDRYNLNIVDKVLISSTKNYNFDELMNKIHKYKKSKNVYVVGFTNAGKSTMINKIMYNYFNMNQKITTSILPSTTLNQIEILLNDDLCLIDTPGLLDNGSIINYLDVSMLKRVVPRKEIRPITYQIKVMQSIMIEDLVRIDLKSKTNITLYMSNALKLKRYYDDFSVLHNLIKHKLKVDANNDVVISGLGFIKVTKPCEMIVYVMDKVDVYVRPSLI